MLHQSDLTRDDPYNSRKNVGLPPTPIAAVSRASLDAALHPDSGDEFFYVLDPNLPPGQHFFTASASEFEAAKARCKRPASAALGRGHARDQRDHTPRRRDRRTDPPLVVAGHLQRGL